MSSCSRQPKANAHVLFVTHTGIDRVSIAKIMNELPRRKQRGIRIKIDSAGSLGAIVDIPFLAFLHI